MAQPGDVQILVTIRDREIYDVVPAPGSSSDLEVTRLDDPGRKELKRSPYGLRYVETVYEVQVQEHATLGTACYIVIGGYRVKVPCG
jgi:hypothetical protein